MGIFKSPKPPRAAPVPTGPSASEIRAQEEAKIKEENLARLQEQESSRQKLRAAVSEDEDEDQGVISRKRLFGE